MSQNLSAVTYLGLDVAKATLQPDFAGQSHALTNDATGHAQTPQAAPGAPRRAARL
jgi:hypothetical protein